MIIGIIGAGASGMAAAISASEYVNSKVILFERQARVGRKLQATGNGRCNLTNIHADALSYLGDSPDFATSALKKYNVENTITWFRDMGLFTVAEPSGRVYPYSDHANSVVDVLRFALLKENIELKTGFEITKLHRKEMGFLVQSNDETVFCDKVIIACGGLAGTKLGGSMSGYQLLRSMGHKSTKLRPALVQLKCAWNGVAALKGVRANCKASIFKDGHIHSESIGELQFTDYGVSGPVIFEVSRDACCGRGKWTCRLDFLPEISIQVLENELLRRVRKDLPVEELLTGILHNRLGRVLTKDAGIGGGKNSSSLSQYEIEAVCRAVKAFEIELSEPMGMDSAQVTAGGIKTEGFDPDTLESRIVPGLYACGEVLDIDGPCGGYNLQWAWSSGRLAGTSAGREDV